MFSLNVSRAGQALLRSLMMFPLYDHCKIFLKETVVKPKRRMSIIDLMRSCLLLQVLHALRYQLRKEDRAGPDNFFSRSSACVINSAETPQAHWRYFTPCFIFHRFSQRFHLFSSQYKRCSGLSERDGLKPHKIRREFLRTNPFSAVQVRHIIITCTLICHTLLRVICYLIL